MNFSSFTLIVLARYKLILFTLFVTVLTTMIISMMLPKSYKSTARLVLTYKGADPVTGIILTAQQITGYMATQLDVIKSFRTASIVIDQLKLDQSEVVKKQYEDSGSNLELHNWLATSLLKNLDIETSRDSSVIRINYKSGDPKFASIMANAFANAYQEISIRLTVEPSQKAAGYFTERLNVLRERLENTQKNLSHYQREKGIVDADLRLDIEIKRLHELSSQLVDAQAELMGTMSEDSGREGHNIVKTMLISSLKKDLSQAESRFSDISQRFGRNHPTYLSGKAEVDKLRSELSKHIKDSTLNAANHELEINLALEEQKAKVLALNHARDDLQLLVREVEGAQHAYDSAMQRLNQTTLEGQSNLSSVSILDAARIPDSPDSPKIFLNVILSLFLGMLLALGVGFLAEMIDRRVRSAEDLVEILQAPVLGVIKREIPKQRRLLLTSWPRLIR